MRVVSRAAVAIAAGLVSFGSSRGFTELRDIPGYAQEVNQKVERCVPSLGQTATRASELPEECKNFEDNFEYEETIVYAYDPKERVRKEISVKRTYTLPSAAELREQHFMTPTDIQEEETEAKNTDIGLGGFIAVFGFCFMSLADVAEKRRKRKQDELRKNKQKL